MHGPVIGGTHLTPEPSRNISPKKIARESVASLLRYDASMKAHSTGTPIVGVLVEESPCALDQGVLSETVLVVIFCTLFPAVSFSAMKHPETPMKTLSESGVRNHPRRRVLRETRALSCCSPDKEGNHGASDGERHHKIDPRSGSRRYSLCTGRRKNVRHILQRTKPWRK